MPEPANQNRLYRFGTYELDASTGDLRKDGKSRPRLHGQILEVLLHLLDRPGEVVTREELRLRLWPADTFVDYDHSLNTAVNKLREALSDSADNSRFIQTIPRRGYRFIASVQAGDVAASAAKADENLIASVAPAGTSQNRIGIRREFHSEPAGMLSDARELPSVSRPVVRLLFSLIQAMYFTFYVLSLANAHRIETFLSRELQHPAWIFVPLLVSASVGIPIRLYLLTASIFGYKGLTSRFLKLFPALFILDELWGLAPFLTIDQVGTGLALAATAALLYVPFSQRSLLLMGESNSKHSSE